MGGQERSTVSSIQGWIAQMNKCVPGVSVLAGIVVSPPAGTKLSGGPGSPVVGFMKILRCGGAEQDQIEGRDA